MTASHISSQSVITQQCRIALLAVLGQLDPEEADRRRSDDLSLLLEVVRSYRPVPAAVRWACEEGASRDGTSATDMPNQLAAVDSWLSSFKLPLLREMLPPSEVVLSLQPSEQEILLSEGHQRPQVDSIAEGEAPLPRSAIEPATSWVAQLICSEIFERQKQVGGRGLPSDDVFAKLLDALDRRGGKMTSVALARAIDFPPMRLPGLLAKVQRMLNIDGYSVLSLDDTSDTIELNRDLLLKQFHLT